MHNTSFGFDLAQPLGFPHQVLVDFNVGTHLFTSLTVYVDVHSRPATKRQLFRGACHGRGLCVTALPKIAISGLGSRIRK